MAAHDDSAPLRAELYGAERLQEYALELARSHQIAPKATPRRFILSRLKENEKVLYAAQTAFTAEVSAGHPIPPGAEWLLDNFYIVQEQLREIRQDLSNRFYRELPELVQGPYSGYPRVYALAIELIVHTDSHLDEHLLSAFPRAYQTVTPLTTGELWAFPIMLRVGLIENLKRLISRSLQGLDARRRADAWADRLLMVHSRPASEFFVVLAELARSSHPEPEFVLQLMQRLRDQDPAVAPAIQWLETAMAQGHSDIDTFLRELNHRRAINRVSVGNVVTSMRLLSALDWHPVVEGLSLTSRMLEQDPAGAFAQMDFETRDRYRHVVESLARRAHVSESEVARSAVELAARVQDRKRREAHVGYYLIDRGLSELKGRIGYGQAPIERARRWAKNQILLFYLGSITVLTLLIVLSAVQYGAESNGAPWQLALVALLMLLPSGIFALDVVNGTVTLTTPPYPPPKLEFNAGIPTEYRTMVVIPALLSTLSGIQYLLEHLERRYLANRDQNLHFALLADLADAPSAHMPEDAALLNAAISGIQNLIDKYAAEAPDCFCLLHRERQWNPVAKTWMGWERKRGNLTELNRLLRGATDTSFTLIVGQKARLADIKFVITLDADTELPLNAGRRLVGAMAHPLNRPVIDPVSRRVVEGYGIIQPRVDPSAQAAAQSYFSRLFTGKAGLDPYSSVVSSVYQDLFHTGVYVGKAIYDVDALRCALEGRFPENLLLSHDLLEGAFARVGLASDIVLLEDFPSGYDAFTQRQQRWTRGDWQITDWLLPKVPDAHGQRVANALPAIERWKILDNLRRSLIAPAIVLLLIAGWTVLPGSPLVWTVIGVAAMVFALARAVLSALEDHPQGEPWRDYFLSVGQAALDSGERALLVLILYLFQAVENLEAIGQAIMRRLGNPGRLLEWVSAAAVEKGQAKKVSDYVLRMWHAPLLALLLIALVALASPRSLVLAAPVLALWLVSPLVAFRISQPLNVKPGDLPESARRALLEDAKRIWLFFDHFAGEQDHWLPPDNYQAEPRAVVAHRTSPTNIGFLLLAILSAFDLKLIAEEELISRVGRVFDSLESMPQYRGHWFNWYDTITLQPLQPPYISTVDSGNLAASLIVMKQACLELAASGSARAARLQELARCADEMARGMEFQFLFNPQREIFVTGFNAATRQIDSSYYDLLDSEARLTSLIAIAFEQVPPSHWFHLSRPLTHIGGHVTLLSWGGTMFESLMPTLFTPDYPYTLLHETYEGVIDGQIAYGGKHRMPWGVSESGYYAFDFQFNYQYRMFGVPDQGLKRNMGEDLVAAPYATFLTFPFVPKQAWENLQALRRAGGEDVYGFYEALDYTPGRRPNGREPAVVRSFMAHHQGMSLVALNNFLNNNPTQRRFEREPAIGSVALLLQERVPQHTPLVEAPPEERPERRPVANAFAPETRTYTTPHTSAPRAHMLSNGEYTVMVTNAGGGYSTFRDLDVTRWSEDRTCDSWGQFLYIKDVVRGHVWSAAYQPTRREPEEYRVTYTIEGVEFWRTDEDIESKMQIAVSPEENLEVRRVILTNRGSRSRSLELTSYAEVVLDGHRADASHPAFGKLFIESERMDGRKLLLFKRRPLRQDQAPRLAFHMVAGGDLPGRQFEYETDRARFVGRGRSTADPIALRDNLSNTTGAVLDPIMSLRGWVRLRPGESKSVAFITGVTGSREEALALGDEFSDARGPDRAFQQARAHGRIVLQHLNASAREGQMFQKLASRVLYPEPEYRAPAEVVERNVKGVTGLWPHGVSGDYPIVLVRVDSAEELSLVRQILLAHEYWRLHNFRVDVIILDESPTMYSEGLHGTIQGMINTSLSHPWLDKPGGVFVRRAEHMPPEDRVLLQTVARVILNGDLGELDNQFRLASSSKAQSTAQKPTSSVRAALAHANTTYRGGWPFIHDAAKAAAEAAKGQEPAPKFLDNGLGGFSSDGREYVITLEEEQWTPAPWTNILANPEFGTLVTESGLGCAWAVNSQQNKLTPWSNDPIADPPGQAIFLYDEDSRQLWSPTPLPIRETEGYTIRHGLGYTSFEHESHNLAQSVRVFVHQSDPAQILRLRLKNLAKRDRRISVTYYAEWVLHVTREEGQHYVITEFDAESQAILARNTFNDEFNPRVAFAASGNELSAFTADRGEFLGRNGTLKRPAALLNRAKLSGAVGSTFDPCAALQVRVELRPGEEKEVLFFLGQGGDAEVARKLVEQFRKPGQVQAEYEATGERWNELLGAVQVETPDRALDLMLNRALLYQVVSSRLWGRTAFYQSSGAWGFRDQLQDVMALLISAPHLAREHILRSAARQFVQGDVQHWWHPPQGKGIRTRISDDPLWLSWAVEHYVTSTGDADILQEQVPYLQAPLLAPEQDESYGLPDAAAQTGSLFEHCVRAIDHCTRLGEHGLPLMGTGDWNDGMNAVGKNGKGESVWLGWFLYANLVRFAPLCEAQGDGERAKKYRADAEALLGAIESTWDGAWYLRAFFDDGTPLGSAQNSECKIDSVAQTWAIISGGATRERRRAALESVEENVVLEHDDLILLLAPPFDQSTPSPGYIEGYIPGIRENGGQYTHASIWVVLAHLLEGDGDRGYQLYKMLNPLSHADSPGHADRYKVEPYVVAGDIYSHPMHLGRGGWTWYTGSAAWMYRVGVETLLGLRLLGSTFSVEPCIPKEWEGYRITFRDGETHYEIRVENPHHVNRGVDTVEVDGVVQSGTSITRHSDGQTHRVRVVMG